MLVVRPPPTPCLLCLQAERARNFAQQHQPQIPPALPAVRVYTASYAGPLEKAAFQGAVTRETAVFADLIRAKQHLVLPLDMGSNALQQVSCSGYCDSMHCHEWSTVYFSVESSALLQVSHWAL